MFDDMKDDKKLPIRDREREELEEARDDVQNAEGKFICPCSVCQKKMDKFGLKKMPKTLLTALSIIDRETYYKRFEGEEKDFIWLMEMMLGPNDRVKGCEVIFPDTVLFKNGKPTVVIKMDTRDYCLYGLKSDTKLNL